MRIDESEMEEFQEAGGEEAYRKDCESEKHGAIGGIMDFDFSIVVKRVDIILFSSMCWSLWG